MSHCEENREIYVRVKDSTDYECIKAIFEKYKLSINTYRGSLVLNDVWVSLNNEVITVDLQQPLRELRVE